MNNFVWTCPHCDRPQTASHQNFSKTFSHLSFGQPAEGQLGYTVTGLRCLADDCGKSTVEFTVGGFVYAGNGVYHNDPNKVLLFERLLPRGASKPQPEYIPQAIRSDYAEACAIRDLSPKASATLARRCLQGMIRDFAGIAKPTLDAEIKALQVSIEDGTADRAISVESVTAIDHVRKIGNIGAHMEKDINFIIDVDADEAQALIELIETLLSEWYVDRHKRQERLKAVEAIRHEKDQAKLTNQSRFPALPSS